MRFWATAGEPREIIRYSPGAEVLSKKLETLGRAVEGVIYLHAKSFKCFCLFSRVVEISYLHFDLRTRSKTFLTAFVNNCIAVCQK